MPEAPQPSTPKPRIQSLSDMIFGLALSIGALTLIQKTPTDSSQVQSGIIFFGFSFLILISVWLRYTNVMSVLPIETAGATALNIVMLFCVSIEPYLFNLLQTGSGNALFDYASVLYAIDLGTLFAILGLFTHQLTRGERTLIPNKLLNKYKWTRNREFFSATLFLASATPPFTYTISGVTLRFLFWLLPAVTLPVGRLWPRFR